MSHESAPLNAKRLKNKLLADPILGAHPHARVLVSVAVGGSNISSAGFPYVVEESFYAFVDVVPHLFKDGLAILNWVDRLDVVLKDQTDLTTEEKRSLKRTRKVLRNVVYTAAVTAPSDLWLLRQVLGVHGKLGILEDFLLGDSLEIGAFSARHGLCAEQLSRDWHFLVSRGYLVHQDGKFRMSPNIHASAVLGHLQPMPESWMHDRVGEMVRFFKGEDLDQRAISSWLRIAVEPKPTGCWIADAYQIDVGYRLLPIILGMRANNLTADLKAGDRIRDKVPSILKAMVRVFKHAAVLDEDERITAIGQRVFERGPGPFGIIGAYESYMTRLEDLLRGKEVDSWVSRGENVAASQDANSKTFKAGNDSLDAFCERYGHSYNVFIEHAVGKGEATRQRHERNGEDHILYFGADLEDAAINEAVKQQEAGVLPRNMRFIRNADIGKPNRVTDQLAEWQVSPDGAIMIVGNGFHEVRQQTNERMVEVFKEYQEAGLFLIFTEESALNDEDLINTAWNTYHAGFRYVHEVSGQGLRPAIPGEESRGRWSWPQCASEAGYLVHPEYTHRTRTIYPFRKPDEPNPSISMTYFCIPKAYAEKLGVE